ncbi:nucleoside hydrolase [uncultured Lactobacillus sp.]|uniref:nucleoside hydrolase n=1 Tax=uncultured Lactobacillus sp. TaxID=153152 RepID=UPI002626CDD7|nr:nucleoside hydrolase [uncultured Lactobacillus sp.]
MKNIYFDHDGNIDDLVSLLLLLQAPDIKLIGVAAVDGDGYIDPSMESCRKMIDRFNLRNDNLEVARSDARAIHQFPEKWRIAPYSFNYFPILNESGQIKTREAKLPAYLDMIEKIKNADGLVDLVMTGPITDLAKALDKDSSIQEKIGKVYWMGGSLDGHGNVVAVDADGSQEWNAFWDPEAVKRVLQSDLDIQMVGLESTEEIPLTDELRQHWASLRKYPAIDLVGLGYSLIISIPGAELYLWDVLTTMSCLYPELVTSKTTKASIITDTLAAGRMYEDPNGKELTLVTGTNKEEFFDKMDMILKRKKN